MPLCLSDKPFTATTCKGQAPAAGPAENTRHEELILLCILLWLEETHAHYMFALIVLWLHSADLHLFVCPLLPHRSCCENLEILVLLILTWSEFRQRKKETRIEKHRLIKHSQLWTFTAVGGFILVDLKIINSENFLESLFQFFSLILG